MAIPGQDEYKDGMNFLFIALEFERKGGRICTEAFQKAHEQFPEARLTIVGDCPPADVQEVPGVSYVGCLRKSVPAEMSKLTELYATAFALVHPTSSDIQPLVICEAGYHGCPSIAAKSFGIPELIKDKVTGFLVDTPLTSDAFAVRMIELCSDRPKYLSMRKAVRAHSTTKLTWNVVGAKLAAEINSALGDQSAVAGSVRAS
jgi:glycosyltransferase involved in cell wall biosynthesis